MLSALLTFESASRGSICYFQNLRNRPDRGGSVKLTMFACKFRIFLT